ncbi:MAG: GIY-YIG nuclease family protein [Patescibacteria group bacterium]|nr:GIY-YIG nuclease family protein [Patescibacteria group bacterium]MEA2088931.1 GIY-YIG nuclease family protein [Patescibacteria group bacterium]
MTYNIYILVSENRKNWSYVGQTDNLKRRIREHNLGKVKSTKGMRPLKVIYTEEYKYRYSSLERENYLKSGIGREEKKQIILNYSGIV